MKYLALISLLLTLLAHTQGDLVTSQEGDAEVSLPGYSGYIMPPQLLYSAMKRNLQKKSKEKHRMLFTRMGRADPDTLFPGLEETINYERY